MLKGKNILSTIAASALILVAAAGCQKSSTDLVGTASNANGYTPPPCYGFNCATPVPTSTPVPGSTPPGGGVSNPAVPTPPPLTTGATGQLVIANQNVFNTYVGAPLNNPSNIQINLQLHPTGSSPQVFLGELHIRYNDDQGGGRLILHDGRFTNGTSNANGNNVSVKTVESGTGVSTYRIFFEDRPGAIIVTLQAANGSSGDTGGRVNGKVWFKNFGTTVPNPLYDDYYEATSYCDAYDPSICIYYGGVFYNRFPANPNAFCWAGTGNGPTTGPFDCRNFSVQPSTNGDQGFTFLGTVNDLDVNSALGL